MWWFQIFLIFHPLLGEMIPNFDKHIFQMGWFNHQLVCHGTYPKFFVSFHTCAEVAWHRLPWAHLRGTRLDGRTPWKPSGWSGGCIPTHGGTAIDGCRCLGKSLGKKNNNGINVGFLWHRADVLSCVVDFLWGKSVVYHTWTYVGHTPQKLNVDTNNAHI